jgi:hypothetical protein
MPLKQHQYLSQIQNLVQEHLVPVLMDKLEGQRHFINEVRQNLSNNHTTVDQDDSKVQVLQQVRKIKARKELLAKSVNKLTIIPQEVELDEDFQQFFTELQAYVETLPESILTEQSLDRFQRFPDDPLKIKIGKTFKKWGLNIGWVPQKIANWVREKSNKPVKPLKMWKHEVPLRGMLLFHYRDLLVEQMLEMVQSINRAVAASTFNLYELEAGIDQQFSGLVDKKDDQINLQNLPADQDAVIEKIIQNIQDLSDSISGATSNRLDRLNSTFLKSYELVGTIEMPASSFDSSSLDTSHKRAVKAYKKSMDGWRNTLTVLSDRYNFDHELFNTRFTNFEQYLFFSQKLESKVTEKILEEIDKIAEFLVAKRQTLTEASAQDEDFKKTLKEVRFETSRFLKRMVPECIKIIREENIPALVDNLESRTKHEIAQLSDTRSMVKNISYEHAIAESDINKIAPRDLITFEALPQYLKTIRALHDQVKTVNDETQQHLMEISDICDFNLETALAAIDDTSQQDQAKSMSIEGFERAHSRLQDIVTDLKQLAPQADSTLREAMKEFNGQILALNEIDQVFDTEVRIAKARAVERARALRQQFFTKLREFIPRLITVTRRHGLMLYKRYRDTSIRYGIGGPTRSLTAEISGFLADTERTLRNLPFVYQRLFEIAPLDNIYFYEPRPLTNLDLKKAYENWLQGHYGGTALIGEAGSGATTLIRFFLNELKSPYPVTWLGSEKRIYKPKDLFDFFGKSLEIDAIDSTESLIRYLNQSKDKRIFILEDLEHFFLRKVNGFDCIHIFIELLTRTNENIFWLITINQFSYQYLVKTTGIDDCFSYNVQLRPLKPEQVTSLVLKRHRVSGFSLVYRPHKFDRKNAKFKKMNEEERQKYLQQEYVNSLNQIVGGNCSLALIYWLRSIVEIQEDVMFIRSLKGVDTSFLLKLSDDKLFTLHAMLLHDGITITDYATIFKQTDEKSKLTILPLYDDGLIVYRDERFHINPLLFRQVVNLLTDKNLLH